jgi:phosphatidylglycerol---prolipoprotein diacylglyceryl transferase
MHYENAGFVFYGIIIFTGFVCALAALKLMKFQGINSGFELSHILPVLIIGAIIGAKIPVIVSYGFSHDLLWTGKSYFGALLGAFFAMNIYKATAGIKGNTGDRFVVPLCLSAGIGKIGCYIYGCCGGTPTDFFIKIRNHAGIFVHPTQLYEASFEAFALVFFIYLYKTGKLQGAHFMLYLILYMIFRFCVEFLRTEPRIFLNLSVYQCMSIIFLPVFIFMFLRRLKNVR